jgi:hypothetical protein
MGALQFLPSASDLPDTWDSRCDHYFQTREFLVHTEKYNPCSQRYYLLEGDSGFSAGAVVYTLPLDLLTFLGIKSPIHMKIVGIPCSVSCSGIVGEGDPVVRLLQKIRIREKGLLLVLNLDRLPDLSFMVPARTLPTVLADRCFGSWTDYLAALRAPYRRRLRIIEQRSAGLRRENLPCSAFDDRMYAQYLEVFNRSKAKLEKLDLVFFKHLPPAFTLTALYHGTGLAGWYITVSFRNGIYFFLGGVDYQSGREHETYFRNLVDIMKQGIRRQAAFIDLGQTAEIPKLRLGGRPCEKYMLGSHSFRPFHGLLRLGKGLLGYKRRVPEAHVLKDTL